MAEPEPAPAGLADAVLLAPLTEDSFLHNLHVRYKRDIIYTYVGNALVSVNPCRALPLYSAELVRTYLARPPYLLPPHLYAITATAYRWVRDRNENQCIVITGESGAGKTEAARVCLQCAVVAGGGGGGALAAAGTLLEAFGNAATARNHNASRFGKLLDIEFDFKGEPVGGHITHYLLEKERVCCVAEGERNFHVLYQLLAGADAHLLKRLKLQRSWEQYRVLRGGATCAEGGCAGAGAGCAGCAACAGAAAAPGGSASPRRAPPQPPPGPRAPQADRDHFAFTKAAMGALGFGAAQCGAVLRVLAFLLKLGNVQFEPQHNIDGSIGTRLQHEYELREACALVGVEADALVLALGAAPPHDDVPPEESCSVEEECSSEAGSESNGAGAGAEWARALRDRLLCALYSRLFTWLVNAINDALKPAVVGARRSLGILDVYGLESLAHNGLERLLINYAAERVQAAVTAATMRREQEEYAREALAWAPLPYADHELYADLLDAVSVEELATIELLINYAAERVQAAVTAATMRREQEEYAREALAWAPLPYADHELYADLLDAVSVEELATIELLINYAAERVQAAVTAATMRREQEEYAREALAWAPLPYADHELYADLLDAVSVEELATIELLINYAAERVQAAVTAATMRREQEEYAREALAWAPLPYADHELYADLLDAVSVEELATIELLINYAAERVQAAVTAATMRREQEEYAREALAWAPLPYADHELYADLLDAGPESVLGMLRDCSSRGVSDAMFLQRLQRRRHPRLLVLPPDRFQVVHFGGPVVYSARGIVAKNRDAVCRRCAAVLAAAREPLLAALFAPGAGAFMGSSGSPRRPCALACRQRALVGALVRRLPSAPRLVRCLRADAALRPHRFDATLLRHQIRTQGIMDMALLRRAGWCESMCARAVLSRYGVLRARATPAPPPGAPASPALDVRDDPVRAARALLRSLPIPSAEFAYGRTKVFIRSPRTVWELEALRAARVEKLVRGAQRAWRKYRARKRHAAAAKIVAAWRRYRQRHAAIERRTVKRLSHRNLHLEPEACGSAEKSEQSTRERAACVMWRAWTTYAKRSYLLGLWARLPARHRSPACVAWPPCPRPRLLARTDALLRRLHHKWRCAVYRRAFDQTARNRMREKVTASVLFKDRKVTYARSVAHPFVGDYVRLRASAAWRRGLGAQAADRYVVFADVVGKVARSSGRVSRCLAVVSTSALLLLEARSLRLKRRVPAHTVYRLSLSPYADDLLVVHVRACGGVESSTEELSQCSSREPLDAPGCLFGGEGAWRRRGDLLLRTCHVLELATKLFLVVQNAVGAPPHVNISTEFEANFGQQMVTVSFHAVGGAPLGDGGARLLRRGSRMDVLL